MKAYTKIQTPNLAGFVISLICENFEWWPIFGSNKIDNQFELLNVDVILFYLRLHDNMTDIKCFSLCLLKSDCYRQNAFKRNNSIIMLLYQYIIFN